MMQSLFDQYGWKEAIAIPLTQGLINQTFEVYSVQGQFILQNINTQVFKDPYAIDHNIKAMGQYFDSNQPDQLFTHLVPNLVGETLIELDGKHYRAFKKIEGIALDVLSTAGQAKEAANQFGQFTANLIKFPIEDLKITIPEFHDLALRYHQFEQALIHGDTKRIATAKDAILLLQSHRAYVQQWLRFTAHQDAHLRVTHHDTKISNVLFKDEAAICVIDLDTTMPGYFISDVGDMCRTYLSPVNEACQDLNLIKVLPERWTAIQEGYLKAMGEFLSNFEKDHFAFSGQCIIYMQALRFLTDYLQLDQYYRVERPSQNLDRTLNQIQLLTEFNQL
ncbi:MAG: aminoglycoside phosphotransferase family protein [Chitinophagia bacterium]